MENNTKNQIPPHIPTQTIKVFNHPHKLTPNLLLNNKQNSNK